MALAHTVASLDTHTGRDELLALDAYRSPAARRHQGRARARPRDPNRGPRAPPGAPGRHRLPSTDQPATGSDRREPTPTHRPGPSTSCSTSSTRWSGWPRSSARCAWWPTCSQVQRLRRERGLPVVASSRHLVFTGNPGTGKTTVARLLAQIYRTLGVVSRGHLVESDRSRLVAGYVGQTATKVTAVFDEADEGVLLIDEAYALVRGTDTDFGREAIDTIVKLVEDRRDRLVVIVAGYPDEMQSLPRRQPRPAVAVPAHDRLPRLHRRRADRDLRVAVRRRRLPLRPDRHRRAPRRRSRPAPRGKGFGNGRLVRNLFERAIERQASSRLVDDARPDRRSSVTMLTGTDLRRPAGSTRPDAPSRRARARTVKRLARPAARRGDDHRRVLGARPARRRLRLGLGRRARRHRARAPRSSAPPSWPRPARRCTAEHPEVTVRVEDAQTTARPAELRRRSTPAPATRRPRSTPGSSPSRGRRWWPSSASGPGSGSAALGDPSATLARSPLVIAIWNDRRDVLATRCDGGVIDLEVHRHRRRHPVGHHRASRPRGAR